MTKPLIIDAHQDLGWNMACFGRDYTRSVADTRQAEAGTLTPQHNGDTLLGWPEYQHGRVAIAFSTLYAGPLRGRLGDWDKVSYETVEQAHSMYRAQVDAYHELVAQHPDKFRLLLSQIDLKAHLAEWESAGLEDQPPVGLTILMEGAEGIRQPEEVELWHNIGVRLIGLAWASNQYTGGTKEPGPLTTAGFALLDAMAEYNFVLDISHMDEEAVLQALDHYSGPIIASHSNPKALMPNFDTNRFLSDRVIQGLLERDAVIGTVVFNRFLSDAWKKGDPREGVPLTRLIDHIDYLCQMAGNAQHVGIGTDFDGGYGLQSVPPEIDTVADLQKIGPLLSERGYSDEDIAAILGRNWLRVLETNLPETAA